MKFVIRLQASSNISYDRRVDSEIDREDWDAMDTEDRRAFIREAIEEAVWNDIEGSVEFANPDDDPDA